MKPKIIILIPVYRNVPEIFFIHFISTFQKLIKSNKYDIEVIPAAGQPVDKIRNVLVNYALKKNPDYILFLDSDQVFLPSMLECLLSINQDVVSALCFQRLKPHNPAIRIKGKVYKDFNEGEILEVDQVGLACILIKASVFKKIKSPWFKCEWRKKDGKDYIIMEDFYFSDRLREAGYKIFVHTGVISDHFGTEVGIDNFKYYKSLLSTEEFEKNGKRRV